VLCLSDENAELFGKFIGQFFNLCEIAEQTFSENLANPLIPTIILPKKLASFF
jgi:hypothetical protein